MKITFYAAFAVMHVRVLPLSTGININNKLSTLVDAEKQKFIIKFFTFLLEPFFNENQTLFSTLCNLKQSS